MKKLIVLLAVALVIPTSVAFANASPTRGKSAPKVMYVLKGTFSSFTAASSTADGSLSITVSHANYHWRQLHSDTLTFTVASNTRITFGNGTTSLADGTQGMVKFRAPLLRHASGATLDTLLPAKAKALHVIVQKAAPTS
jgi:hypothetical protein